MNVYRPFRELLRSFYPAYPCPSMIRERKTCMRVPDAAEETVAIPSTPSCKFDDMTAEMVPTDIPKCDCPAAAAATAAAAPRRPWGRHTAPVVSPASRSHRRSNLCSSPCSRSRPRVSSPWLTLRRTIHRFGKLLLVGVWLLSAVHLPVAMSAPIGSLEARFNSKPKWINPCGAEPHSDLFSSADMGTSADSEPAKPFESVLVTARLAKEAAERFKEDYVRQTFNVDFPVWHDHWKSQHYSWLPTTEEIPKNLGEPVPEDHLEKLDLDLTLKDIYQYLQKYAVGLEQITWDQEDTNGGFTSHFTQAEHSLKAMLCEVYSLMMERSVRPHPDVGRDLMDPSMRLNSNTSLRNLRDWLIYRDYMNGLEYVIQVLEHFDKKYML